MPPKMSRHTKMYTTYNITCIPFKTDGATLANGSRSRHVDLGQSTVDQLGSSHGSRGCAAERTGSGWRLGVSKKRWDWHQEIARNDGDESRIWIIGFMEMNVEKPLASELQQRGFERDQVGFEHVCW